MVSANQLSYIESNTPENLNFLGICFGNKKCQETKAQKQLIKAQAKADVKVERAKRNTERALTLANKGIDNSWAAVGKGAIAGFSTLLGSSSNGQISGLLNIGNGTNTDPMNQGGYYPEEIAQPDNTGLYIGLGVGGLLIVGLIVYAIAKK